MNLSSRLLGCKVGSFDFEEVELVDENDEFAEMEDANEAIDGGGEGKHMGNGEDGVELSEDNL